MITAYAINYDPDPVALYREFLEGEADRSGTVVLHHGRVKRPGKQVPNFQWVELRTLVPAVDDHLRALARGAQRNYGLHRVLLVHRLGRVQAGDTVLVALVSGETRDRCFDGCRYLVDEIKREAILRLIEHS